MKFARFKSLFGIVATAEEKPLTAEELAAHRAHELRRLGMYLAEAAAFQPASAHRKAPHVPAAGQERQRHRREAITL